MKLMRATLRPANLCELAEELIARDQYRVLIVDSAMALFRIDYTARAELTDRQQKLNHQQKLKKYLLALL